MEKCKISGIIFYWRSRSSRSSLWTGTGGDQDWGGTGLVPGVRSWSDLAWYANLAMISYCTKKVGSHGNVNGFISPKGFPIKKDFLYGFNIAL
jgi:hypothetical protein